MFSLFQEKPPEETPSGEIPVQRPPLKERLERLYALVPAGVRSNGLSVTLAIALFAAVVFGFHERQVAAHLSPPKAEPTAQATQSQLAAQLNDTRSQLGALTAKLDALTNAQQQPAAQAAQQQAAQQQAVAGQAASPAPPVRRNLAPLQSSGQRQKPDPRFRRMQTQLDAQGKAIDAQGKAIESTRQEVASARSDLGDSIAKTHEELVVLQKKGERNYFEFDLDKSKNFNRAGPVGISLRKANTKHLYADLELLVDDRQLSKKHLNLYEPVVFYPSDERQPVELVIISITKNHIHGYISAAKYKAAELTAGSSTASPSNPPPRRKLDAQR